MNNMWKSPLVQQQQKDNRKPHMRLLRNLLYLLLVVMVGINLFLLFARPGSEPPVHSELNTAPATANVAEPVEQAKKNNTIRYDISDGDTLGSIFDNLAINQTTMYQILAADEQLLALDVLRPGNRLIFTREETTQKLLRMELFIHLGRQVIYSRIDDQHFEYEEIDLPGTWDQQVVASDIKGNFFLSALSAGLTEQEAGNITEIFEARLDFRRDIKAGDQFEVIRSRQFINGEFTGQSQILGVRLSGRRYQHDAFLFEDGNYYDHEGKSLARSFRRYPFNGHHRISSSFNPKRLHPVTKRISPHNGTDFSMPVGTAVLAVGDGVVTRVKNHPFAGKYIDIQHGGSYKTRYLHLSRATVKPGQHVKRGERIALSGNTGRLTGAHLHYELHFNGRVVNPVKAKIPLATSISKDKFPQFSQRVAELTAFLDQQTTEHQKIAQKTEHSKDSI